jgi:glycosyltransferase involved in cell wall biosynthesis
MSDGSWRIGKLASALYQIYPFAPSFHRKISKSRAVLIHAHFALDGTEALYLQSALNVPLLVTLHGYDITSSDAEFERTARGRHYLANRSELWNRASKFICVSEAIKTAALKAGIPKEKLVVHYIGIDLKNFQRNHLLVRDPHLILFVGRLVEKKGCEFVIRALSQLTIDQPRAHLVVIGHGPLRRELEALASKLGVKVRFLGPQNAELVRMWMGKARILCVPSVQAKTGDSEGFGMVFAEAQSMGTPVVSTWHSAIPEVVRHGVTGLLAAERDCTGLAHHICRFLSDHIFWSTCGNRAITHIRDNFDLQRQTFELEKTYSSVL